MSTSPARRRRLAVARTFRQATCAECGADLSRVDFPAIHLNRCEELAKARTAAAEVREEVSAGPGLAARFLRLLGIQTRGAAE